MLFSSAFRIIKFALQNFRRNFWLAIVTITILFLTLFSVNALVFLNVVSNQAVQVIEKKINISVYFYPKINEVDILRLRSEILALPNIAEVIFVNREEALPDFRDYHQQRGDDHIVSSIDELDENPLPNTLIIRADNIQDYPIVLEFLNKKEHAELIEAKDFNDHKKIIERIGTIKIKVRDLGIMIIAIFGVIAALIVFNTVRIAIYTHRREISIMRLVGASNWFIRAPFLAEEILYALFAFVIIAIFFFPLIGFLEPHMSYFLGYQFSLVSYFQTNGWLILGAELLAIIILNVISTFVAIKRYLK